MSKTKTKAKTTPMAKPGKSKKIAAKSPVKGVAAKKSKVAKAAKEPVALVQATTEAPTTSVPPEKIEVPPEPTPMEKPSDEPPATPPLASEDTLLPANQPAVAPATPKASRKTSALDAAAQVLRSTSTPMNAIEMIDAMATQGLWSSPNGKTPHATLYSAIVREIAVKGSAARFRKTDRGRFALVTPN